MKRLRRAASLSIIMALTVLFPTAAPAATAGVELQGVVSGHAGGDTFSMVTSGQRWLIKLYGVAAPHLEQPWGDQAYKELRKTIPIGASVTVKVYGTTATKTLLADVYRDRRYVNGHMVRSGNAWAADPELKPYSNFHDLEMRARREKLGLWSRDADATVPPWTWNPLR